MLFLNILLLMNAVAYPTSHWSLPAVVDSHYTRVPDSAHASLLMWVQGRSEGEGGKGSSWRRQGGTEDGKIKAVLNVAECLWSGPCLLGRLVFHLLGATFHSNQPCQRNFFLLTYGSSGSFPAYLGAKQHLLQLYDYWNPNILTTVIS